MNRPDDAPDLPPVRDEFPVESVEQFKALDNPLRMRILHFCAAPHSVKDLAEALDVPLTRLYYHVNLLEGAGFLTVVDVRKSRAQLERIYRTVARSFQPSADLIARSDDEEVTAALAGLIIEPARAEIAGFIRTAFGSDNPPGTVTRALVELPPDRAAELSRRLEQLINEYRDDERGRFPVYGVTILVAPLDPASQP